MAVERSELSQYQRPPRPVSITFGELVPKKAMGTPSLVVDAADLLAAFGRRVRLVRQPETAAHLRMRSAEFDPPLAATDAPLLEKLAAQYNLRRSGPIVAL